MHAPRIIQFLFETFLNIINIIYIYISLELISKNMI